MLKICKLIVATGISLSLSLTSSAAAAQDSYPNRAITWVVPYAAGGATDVLVRIVARKIADDLGQPVVVENKPGAGTMISAQFVAKAPADGYTMLTAVVANMSTAPLMSSTPANYDPVKDFDAVSLITSNPLLLVSTKASGIGSLAELMRLAKEKPGELAIASYGQGTPSHLGIELLKTLAGIDVIHVPYKGAAPALVDLLGGRVPLMMDVLPSHIKNMESGRVVGLAVGQNTRSPLAPDVPTFLEGGLKGFEATTWVGAVVPAGTPTSAIERLNRAFRKSLSDPEVLQALKSQGMPSQPSSAGEFDRIIKTDYEKWGAVIKRANLKP